MPERRRALERLAARIVARTGLYYYADKMDLLDMILARRMEACSCVRPSDYLSLLSDPCEGVAEWRALESAVTIGETFFFRYAEQFHALETTILPDLLRRLRPLRTLRIWSVGCANGAEPYSLAILLSRLLAERGEQDWTIEILGTDISTQALERARGAEYGAWSLRDIGQAERSLWFQPTATDRHWTLRPEYRRMVRFEYGNIMDLPHGGGPAGPFDLILCRNVLIYFETAQAQDLIHQLADRLSPRGWLLLGHSDPVADCGGFLDMVTFPGTLAFRARDSRAGPTPPPARRRSGAKRVGDGGAAPTLAPAGAARRPAGGRRKAAALPPDPRGAVARVRALADGGAVEAALALCRAEIQDRPLDADLHFMSGVLSAGLNDRVGAEEGFRRAVYLCRDHVMAHVHLAHLLHDGGRADEACRVMRQARVLAGRLPPDLLLPEGGGLTAGGLLRLIGDEGTDDISDLPPAGESDRACPDDRGPLLRGVS